MIDPNSCPHRASHTEQSLGYVNRCGASCGSRRFLFLDRDGVINTDVEGYVRSVAAFCILDGVLDAVARVTQAGWIANICTNQPAIGEGLMSHADLDQIHLHLRGQVERAGGFLGEIIYCPHTHGSGCYCRKPCPGQLNTLCQEYSMTIEEVKNAWVVGDHPRDIEAGLAFGCRAALVRTGHGGEFAQSPRLAPEALVFADLRETVDFLIAAQGCIE